MKPSGNSSRPVRARDAARLLHLCAVVAAFAVAFVSVGTTADYSVLIEYTNRNCVSVHFGTMPNKVNALQAAWVYPTNAAPLRYTNVIWSNLVSYPPNPMSIHWPAYQDYSVTNRFTNRFRIYRLRAT